MKPKTEVVFPHGEKMAMPLAKVMTSIEWGTLIKRFAFLLLMTSVAAYGQAPASRTSKSDADKIGAALAAGPTFVSRNATVLDWPKSPIGEFRVLRAGSNGWTCLPGFPGAAHDEPGCYDQVFLQFLKDSISGRTPNVQSVGISYMYGGKWVPNTSHAMGHGHEFHVGPHIMIIGLDQKMMQTLNQDGSNGEPYVNHLPGRTELYLVIPIREWNDVQGARTVGAKRDDGERPEYPEKGRRGPRDQQSGIGVRGLEE